MKQLKFILLVLLFAVGCSKKKEDKTVLSNYYFRATFDGKEVKFSSANFQGNEVDGGWQHMVIGAVERTSVSSFPPPSFDFEIWRIGGNITKDGYSTTTEPDMGQIIPLKGKEAQLFMILLMVFSI